MNWTSISGSFLSRADRRGSPIKPYREHSRFELFPIRPNRGGFARSGTVVPTLIEPQIRRRSSGYLKALCDRALPEALYGCAVEEEKTETTESAACSGVSFPVIVSTRARPIRASYIANSAPSGRSASTRRCVFPG